MKAGYIILSEYKWSSYNDYICRKGFTDIDFALNMMNEDRDKALVGFIKYYDEQVEEKCLEIEERFRLTDEEAKEIIKKKCGITSSLQLKDFGKEKRDNYIRELKNEGLSTRQIERLTGISRSVILNT